MSVRDYLWYLVAPAPLMLYGWYLGQTHVSMQDLAGILLFLTGVGGYLVALFLHVLTRRFSWHDRWYARVLTSILGCALVFAGIVVYARVHG